jgi:hypothetical protein
MLILGCASCTSSKHIVGAEHAAKRLSARKVSKNHITNSFDKQTIEAKLKVTYKDVKNEQKFNVKLKVAKDKVIWLSATYFGILVARAEITPTTVRYYEKINKTYFTGNFQLLKEVLGADVTFLQLQNMLLGQSIADLKAQKYTSVIDNNAYLLVPSAEKALLDVLFWINPTHFKLDKQELRNLEKNQTLKVAYTAYTQIEDETFPKKIEIRAKEHKKFTNIDIEYKSVIFSKDIATPFKVPNGYKQVVL